MSTQAATARCDRCGAVCPVTAESAYEFAWRCEPCKAEWVVSWSHKSPAPEFTAVVQQGSLFEVGA